MKKLMLIAVLSVSMAGYGQWVTKSSCKKQAKEISNQAIEYMANLEYLTAFGLVKAALIVDENCGSAQLVHAAIASGSEDWGSRATRLKKINRSKLSGEEQFWYDYLSAPGAKRDSIQQLAVKKYPKSPLLNYLGTSINDFSTYEKFASMFPQQAASSYNMLSYGYMMGAMGDVDKDKAMDYLKRVQQMHDGPNAYDSEAEHLASLGMYEEALDSQLKAVDFGTFASPYMVNARVYWSHKNATDITERLIEMQEAAQTAILESNAEELSKYLHEDITMTTGDSNLNDHYVFSVENMSNEAPMSWNTFEMSGFEVYYSPNMETAILTFKADGSFTMNGAEEAVAYATRASAVWVATDEGWKMMHSSWAPRKGMNGIPDLSN